jgi:LPXTG-site transpeptidase (sortase) family protein
MHTLNFKKILYYLGNILIISSIAIITYIYFPFVNLYLNPPKIDPNLRAKGYYIQIPKIGAQAPIILNVNPWNPNDYLGKLEEGVAQGKGTAIPGDKGTSFLFAHSSDAPWRIARYNIVFFRLGELNKGDLIFILRNGKKLTYVVRSKKEVWPNDVSFLKNLQKTQLILQTCTPIGTDFKRLLVFADPLF